MLHVHNLSLSLSIGLRERYVRSTETVRILRYHNLNSFYLIWRYFKMREADIVDCFTHRHPNSIMETLSDKSIVMPVTIVSDCLDERNLRSSRREKIVSDCARCLVLHGH